MTALPDAPAWRDRLSTRIVVTSLAALVIVLGMVGWTLWLSWQLEGAAAAINDTGSLRMRANRVAVDLLQPDAEHARLARREMEAQRDTLDRLARGVPSRPLFLPADPLIHAQMKSVTRAWTNVLETAAEQALKGGGAQAYLRELPAFVEQADRLVRLIEADNASKTTLLRLSQAVLIVMAIAGTLAMVYLLYLWIISPVLHLQDGLRRMAAREFSVRLPVEGRDEFGTLAQGFNRMADELEASYRDLEARVQRKTAQLAAQNRELGALYDLAAFLNQPNTIEDTCRGFLRRVMERFHADGGSIRVIDPLGDKLHLIVSEGLSESLSDAEHCMRTDACFCGEATQEGTVVIRDFRRLPKVEDYHCAKDGFKGLTVFRIVNQDQVLGSFSLHFRDGSAVPAAEAQLLETLGQHLGVALENLRLSAKARQLAVAEERNLVAQGLHDSIAQGLNFLNLQVQMLQGAVQREDLDEARGIMPMLRAGIDESYQDVRELLVNFRTKLGQGEMGAAVEDTLARFKRQTGIRVRFETDEEIGAPLPPEQQLQVLFILQEALSNVRKHAQASEVEVAIHNSRDFSLRIADNGIGYDPAEVARRGEAHVGLNIMQERAARLAARLDVETGPGAGTRICLTLPQGARQAA